VARGFEVFDVQAAEEVEAHGFTARNAQEVTARALRWLSDGPREPFFLWLHYFDPHDPYEPPEAYRDFDRGNGSRLDGDLRRHLKAAREPGESWSEAGRIFDRDDAAHFANLYDGEIRYTDEQIGLVLDALVERGLLERTVLVFVSDHGEWLGEGERWDHCRTLREVELRVPFLWSVGGARLAGQGRVATPVSVVDLAPTVLALLGIEHHPSAFDGVDLREPPADRAVFADWRGVTAVRRGRWKLVFEDAPLALSDLEAGGESDNRLGEGLAVEAELAREVEAFREAHPLTDLHGEMFEKLRQLGYID
jgi:arylsulfatase